MTDEDMGYWGLKAWLWSLIKNHCALGKICHCTQPLPVCSCGSFPWRDESAVRYQLNYYCIFFGSASSARILNAPGWFQLSLKACDIEHNRDQIQLRSANKQQTWALPVTISAPLSCQSLWKRRCRTMKEPLWLLMWETLIVAARFGTERKRRNLSIFAVLVSSCASQKGRLLPVYDHAVLSCSRGLTKPMQPERRIRYERISDKHWAAKILEDLKHVWHSGGK